MLMNLFSIFDSSIFFFNPFFFFLFFFFFFMQLFINYYYSFNIYLYLKSILFILFFNQIGKNMLNLKNNSMKNLMLMKIFFSLFCFVLMCNLMSLFPMIICITSHLSINMSMTLILWLTYFIFSLNYNWKAFFSHMTPMGTPFFLLSFMVMIESISILIRPLTLSVRLLANMVAGHLLLTLLSNFMLNNFVNYFISILIVIVMSLLEIGVCFIQSYVLLLLLSLYFLENE